MKRPNEANAAEGFALILRAVTGKQYVQVSSPDETNSRDPDVDYMFATPSTRVRRVAAEHTIVETFEGQIRYVNVAFDVVKEINRRRRGKLPHDRHFYLAIADQLVTGFNKRTREAFVRKMSDILPAACSGLQVDQYTTLDYQGHQIWLKCNGSDASINGNVYHIQLTPRAVEPLKTIRLSRALVDKLPKLIRYKFRFYRTALLLEDISGSIGSIGSQSKSLSYWHRILIRLFVDYIVEFASYNDKMIVGNVWKERSSWYALVPYHRRFHFETDNDGVMSISGTAE